jgi:tetratricopeptide (TPR) repeat protein
MTRARIFGLTAVGIVGVSLFLFFPNLVGAWHNNVGAIYLARELSGQKIQAFTRSEDHFIWAIRWNRNMPGPYVGLARLYVRRQNSADALVALTKALELDGEHSIARFELGNVYAVVGAYEEAMQQWYQVRAVFSLVRLGDKLVADGRPTEAQEAYKTAILIDPSNRFAHSGLAGLYQEAGAKHEAIQELTEVVEAAPSFVWTYLRIGDIYRSEKDLQRAIEWYQRARIADPVDPVSHLAVARVYHERDDDAQAVVNATEVVALAPQSVSSYIFLGNIYRDNQDYERARYWYERATGVEPNEPLSWWALGFTFFEQGLYSQAADEFERAARLAPSDPEIHWWLANSYIKQGDKEKAVQELETAISLGGEHVEKYREALKDLQE